MNVNLDVMGRVENYKSCVRMVGICLPHLCQLHNGLLRKSRPLHQKGPQLYYGLLFTACMRPMYNSLQIQGFEWHSEGGGVHWNKLTSLIPTLADMGITAVWIPRNLLPFPKLF